MYIPALTPTTNLPAMNINGWTASDSKHTPITMTTLLSNIEYFLRNIMRTWCDFMQNFVVLHTLSQVCFRLGRSYEVGNCTIVISVKRALLDFDKKNHLKALHTDHNGISPSLIRVS